MRTSNPALSESAFEYTPHAPDSGQSLMTIRGTVNKTLILLALVVAAASLTWYQAAMGNPRVVPLVIGAAVIGFIFALVTIFKPTLSPITAPAYALCEGLVVGGVSAIANQRYPGIALQAAGLTIGTLFALLFAYQTGVIRASDSFRRGVIAATGGIAILYIVSLVLSLFGVTVPFIHESSPIGIAFSVFVVAVAALNLVLDFDFIEQGSSFGLPKYMEWYGAFGLVLTLVWLYLEILRLLSKLRSR